MVTKSTKKAEKKETVEKTDQASESTEVDAKKSTEKKETSKKTTTKKSTSKTTAKAPKKTTAKKTTAKKKSEEEEQKQQTENKAEKKADKKPKTTKSDSVKAAEAGDVVKAEQMSLDSLAGSAGVTTKKVEGETADTSGKTRRRQHKTGLAVSAASDSSDKNTDAKKSDTEDKQKQDKKADKKQKSKKSEPKPSESPESLMEKTKEELLAKAEELEISHKEVEGLKKEELVAVVYKALAEAEGFKKVKGILDILSDGYGFLRCKDYMSSEDDVYCSVSIVRKNGLRKGDEIVGETRPAREGEKFAALARIETVNDIPIEDFKKRPKFADLTPIFPDERLVMEHGQNTVTARVIDLVAPIGKGQRGLIVSPPKAGKTTILKDIAAAISANNPEVHLMCLLIDERPEEVTDMERSIDGEVISSTFDMPCENHTAIAELTIERAKRLVESGRDVVILLDSITRLARAYNLAQPPSGRVLSGGVDSSALYPPKRFLGAARNIENGGSLTILASALIETGSKMDEVIFEEFKGTGNMELKLDRYLADRRIFPAIDPVTSGTRKEDLLLDPQEAPFIWAVRRILANLNNTERAMDMLIKSVKKTKNNQEFLMRTAKKASKAASIEGINSI